MSPEQLLIALLGLAGLVLAGGLVRRRSLQRAGGTVELSLRLKAPGHGRGWVNGVGRFVGDELRWYRVFSLSLRPRRRYSRRSLEVVGRREPFGAEHRALQSGAAVLECRCDGRLVELAMSGSALTGFLAWLEARPPGATLPV